MNFNIYRASIIDLLDVLVLSNSCRVNFFNSKEIFLEEHEKWFKAKLKDENCIFYVIKDDQNAFIGYVRFDLLIDQLFTYEISIAINSNLRCRGLGRDILEKTSKMLFKEVMAKKIIAYIKTDNIASFKCFEKSGYLFKKNIEKNNIKCFVFEFED